MRVVFSAFFVIAQILMFGQKPNYIYDIEKTLLLGSDRRVPFYKTSFYKAINESDELEEYIDMGIVDLSKIDTMKLFQDDTTGTNAYVSIDTILLLNDVKNVKYIEDTYRKYVDQFCDRWEGILSSDFKTYENYKILQKLNIVSRERSAMYGLQQILISYKLHDFKDNPEAIIRVFETGKVDHLNYPILEYQFKCLPKVYWGPATQLNSNVFLPYKDVMFDFLKGTIMSMEIPPDSKARLKDYKNYTYFVQNPEMFRGIIDKDIEEYVIENIEYYLENQAGHMLNSIALQSNNDQFKAAYLEKFMDVYLPQINPNSKFRFGDRNMIYEILNSNYELVSDKIIHFEREIREDKEYHKAFILNILSGIPLTDSFYEAFSKPTEDEEINEVLDRCIRQMAYAAESSMEHGYYTFKSTESELLSRREIKRIIRKYDEKVKQLSE